jgi:hypothetical protein
MLTGHNVDRLARGQHHRQRDVATPKELRMSLSYLNIAPLGTRLDGRPIWPFTGAAPDGDGGGEGGDGDGGDGDGDGGDDGNESDPDSTEGLKKALERERESVKQKSRELRGFKTLMRDTGVKTFDDFKAKVTGGSGTGTGSKGGGNGQQQQEVIVNLADPNNVTATLPVRSGDQIIVDRRKSVFKDILLPALGIIGSIASLGLLIDRVSRRN